MIKDNLIGSTFTIKRLPFRANFDASVAFDVSTGDILSSDYDRWEIGQKVILQYSNGEKYNCTYELRDVRERYCTCELEEEEVRYMLTTSEDKLPEVKGDDKMFTSSISNNRSDSSNSSFNIDLNRNESIPVPTVDSKKPVIGDSVPKENNNKEKEGKKTMMDKMFKDFGAITDGSVALTFNGQIAVKRSEDEYIRYDEDTNTMDNQMSLVLTEASDMIYIMPVTSVEVGDVIKSKDSYYQILSIEKGGDLKTVKIKDGTKKTIIKETNIMGINFFYKVVSLFAQTGNSTTNGIDPMMLMLLSDDTDSDSMLPMMMMAQGQGNAGGMNPMMMMLMMKDKGKEGSKDSKMKDMLMMQMMAGQGNVGAMNPMMMMLMMKGEGKMDMKTMMLMQMMGNQKQVVVQAPEPKKPRTPRSPIDKGIVDK